MGIDYGYFARDLEANKRRRINRYRMEGGCPFGLGRSGGILCKRPRGVILIGVEEYKDKHGRQRGRLVEGKGTRIDQNTEDKIKNVIEFCEEKLEYEVIKEEETPGYGVFVIKISEGKNKPYCTAGGTYKIRIGGRKRSILPAQMREIIHKKLKGEIKLLLITPEGLSSNYRYNVTWDIYGKNEQEDIKSDYTGQWEIKTVDGLKTKVNSFGRVDRKDFQVTPEIKFAIFNEGPANAEKIHGFIDFPSDIKIQGYQNALARLIDKRRWVRVTNQTAKCFVDNIPPTLLWELDKFFIKFPKVNGVYQIKYKIVAGEIISTGHVDITIINHFLMIKNIT
jgi:hypothetical protein